MITHKRTIIIFLLLANLLILGCGLSMKGGTASTPTPIPPTDIPGWEKFEGGGIELWMPNNFEGGDLVNDVDVILQRLRSLGDQYTQMADMIEKNSSTITLLVYDTSIGSSGFLTNVNVVKEKVLSSTKLDAYLDVSATQLTQLGFDLVDQKIVQLDNYEAGRLVIQADTFQGKELMYVIKEKNTMWIITYSAGISEFNSRLPTFEKSANTIKIP